jgi:hypothetical protein
VTATTPWIIHDRRQAAQRRYDPVEAAFIAHDEQVARAFPHTPRSHRCWRWRAANLPPDQWRRWRHCRDRIIDDLDHRPSAAEIQAADRMAAEILILHEDRAR